jgi:hypothetical protein
MCVVTSEEDFANFIHYLGCGSVALKNVSCNFLQVGR